MRLGIASCLLIFRTLWDKTRPEFVSSPENFNLGKEQGHTADSLGDGGFDFTSVEDRALGTGSTVGVKSNLPDGSAFLKLNEMTTRPTHRLSPKANPKPLYRQFSTQYLVLGAEVLGSEDCLEAIHATAEKRHKRGHGESESWNVKINENDDGATHFTRIGKRSEEDMD